MVGIPHKLIDISFLGAICSGVSANIQGSNINMPTMQDIIGNPQPVTYVLNHNMILMSICANVAETCGVSVIISGLQSHDRYGYWDTTPDFVAKMNTILANNRRHQIRIECPFIHSSKADKLQILLSLYDEYEAMIFIQSTITCYNPNQAGQSCGICPSCTERLSAFQKLGLNDPINYQ